MASLLLSIITAVFKYCGKSSVYGPVILFQFKLQKHEKFRYIASSKTHKAIKGANSNIVLCKFSAVHGYMSTLSTGRILNNFQRNGP